jgi:hypothetical protein
MIKVVQQHPQFGVNYGPGWIGFISRRKDFVAAGIDWFSRWEEISGIPISHTFNIAGEDLTIEAFEKGVDDGSLADYLNDPDVALLVRKPRLLDPDMARLIVDTAASHLGEPYNNKLIAAMASGETFLGRGLSWITGGRMVRWICWLADRAQQWICSKLVRVSVDHPPYSQYRGVMEMPPYVVLPIDLFEDVFIFEPGAIELIPSDRALEDDND